LEYFLNDLQKTVKEMARAIAEEKILPVRAELDESEEFPWIIRLFGTMPGYRGAKPSVFWSRC